MKEQCEDCISRKSVIDTIFAECSGTKLDIDFAKVLILQRAIKALPSVLHEEKVGNWIQHTGEVKHIECSNCGCWFLEDYLGGRRAYCPNCGEKKEEI